MQLKKEEELFCKRILELAYNSFQKGMCTYSDFLNLNEINLFYHIVSELPKIDYKLFGGYADAERSIVCFYDKEYFNEPNFPISCINIRPVNSKFSDNLSHRDFLGALIHLGLDRSKLGDILIKDNNCYLFCDNRISQFIVDNLNIIKHTNVKNEFVELHNVDHSPQYTQVTGSVASVRLDAVLPIAFKTSRSSISGLIAGGKVYVNSKLILSNSYTLKEGDIVSVRGMGKFLYKETNNMTKKGRFFITLFKYT